MAIELQAPVTAVRCPHFVAAALLALCFTQGPVAAAAPAAVVVDTVEALETALAEASTGQRIVVARGNYEVPAPLVVPDGVSLEGEGQMLGDKLPTGFAPATVTRIVAADGFVGDLVSLGDGARLRGLAIDYAPGSIGNAVSVGSRGIGDAVAAEIIECEINDPNPSGVAPQGPIGEALVVLSRNLNFGADPPAHADSKLGVRVWRSIIRAPGGGAAVFAINFAANSQIRVSLVQNRIEGQLRVTGGVSRPDAVTGTKTVIRSIGNVYSAADGTNSGAGWQIYGGSTIPIGLVAPSSSSNVVLVDSQQDRIENFATGILAAGGVRFFGTQNPSSFNSIELGLQSLAIRTPDAPDSADLVLNGGMSGLDPADAEFAPGDGNVVRVLVRNTSGSGDRQNSYQVVSGPVLPENAGVGNRLEFVGSATAFARSNRNISPEPAPEFFEE
jgi:hypothetical protein